MVTYVIHRSLDGLQPSPGRIPTMRSHGRRAEGARRAPKAPAHPTSAGPSRGRRFGAGPLPLRRTASCRTNPISSADPPRRRRSDRRLTSTSGARPAQASTSPRRAARVSPSGSASVPGPRRRSPPNSTRVPICARVDPLAPASSVRFHAAPRPVERRNGLDRKLRLSPQPALVGRLEVAIRRARAYGELKADHVYLSAAPALASRSQHVGARGARSCAAGEELGNRTVSSGIVDARAVRNRVPRPCLIRIDVRKGIQMKSMMNGHECRRALS